MNIPIPDGDPFFTTPGVLSFLRSRFIAAGTGSVRQFPNEITAWIDGSNVYGSDEVRAKYLRSFKDGKLRTLKDEGKFLPSQTNSFGSMFEAGDIRVN